VLFKTINIQQLVLTTVKRIKAINAGDLYIIALQQGLYHMATDKAGATCNHVLLFCFHALFNGYICGSKPNLKLLQSTQYANVRAALFVSLLLCFITTLFLLIYGKTGSLLIINGHHNSFFDVLFRYGTYLGDGIIYIPLLIYCIFFNRSFIIPAVSSIIIGLFLAQFFKRVIFPDELRPITLEAQGIVLHKIKGLNISRVYSFPSGHTATAFATAIVLAMVMRKRSYAAALPLIAFFVAYSRVYLAQHFVTDVLGGMVIGIITAVLSIWLKPIIESGLPPWLQAKKNEPLYPE
jgi:membrane-associated phospholipid phosphatase